MESPVRGLRFIHEAINREAADLEERAKTGPLDPARVAFFKKVLHIHAKGEELALFPAVDERVKNVVAPYLLDHREEEELLAQLDGADYLRAAYKLAEHLRLHIKKENEILTPLLERLLTPPEQAQHVAQMMSVFTPQDMAEVLPWMITWLTPDDRRAYLAILDRAMPPERVAGVVGMLRGKLAPEVWQSLGRN
jgi:zinc finger-like protein